MFQSGEKHFPFSKTIKIITFLSSLVGGVLLFVFPAHAATMYLTSAKKTYTVGENFTVNVYLTSADQATNAVEGTVTFPEDKITMTGLSKAGTIMSLWVQEPSYSNSLGTANFTGVVLNPGFRGSAAKVISLSFKAKSAGTVALRFNGGQILANDGRGTNIMSSLGGLQLTVDSGAPVSKEPPKPTVKEPVVEPVIEQPAPAPAPIPATPAVTAPEFTEYKNELEEGEIMVVKGTAQPLSQVNVWVQNTKTGVQKYTTKSNSLGEYIFVNAERVDVGTYKLWTEVEYESGLRSASSRSIYIIVKQAALWERFNKITYYLVIVTPPLALFLLLILMVAFTIKKIITLRRELRKDMYNVDESMYKAFNLLSEDVRAQIKLLERAKTMRNLTSEEEGVVKRLKNDLSSAEAILKDKTDHLEKK